MLLTVALGYAQKWGFVKDGIKHTGIEAGYVRYLSNDDNIYNAGELFIFYELSPRFRFGTGFMTTFPRQSGKFYKIERLFSQSKEAFFNGFHILFLDFGKDKLRYRISFGGIQDSGGQFCSGIRYFFYKKAFVNFEYRTVAFIHSNYIIGLGLKLK